MPTYRVVVHDDSAPTRWPALAAAITDAHAAATGAPRSFAQVVVEAVGSGAHFVGGAPAAPGAVHVHGHIRAGRPPEMLDRLAAGVRDAVVATLGVPDDLVWVYLSELPPAQMIEFGRPLPPPGDEQAWVDALPAALRERLARLDGARPGAPPDG